MSIVLLLRIDNARYVATLNGKQLFAWLDYFCRVRKIAKMSDDGKKNRSENFTADEELVLRLLVDERKNVLQNRTSNAATWKRKLHAWKELADCYFVKTGIRREWQALRQKFMNLKRRSTPQQRSKRKRLSYFSREQALPTAEIPLVNDLNAGMSYTFDSDGSDDLSFIGKDELLTDTANEHDYTNRDENEEDMAAARSEWATGSSSTNCLPKPRNHNLEEETLQLIRLQQEFFRCKNQRAQEKHDLEMLREKAKLDLEMQEGKLRIEIIELEILEKRAKLDMKCGQERENRIYNMDITYDSKKNFGSSFLSVFELSNI